MIKQIIPYIILVVSFAVCQVSCSSQRENDEYARTDSLIAQSLDSIRSNPAHTLARLRKAQKREKDSLSVQRLNLYIGVCLARTNHPEKATQALRQCEAYLRRHPRTDHILKAEYWYTKGCLSYVNNTDSTLAFFTRTCSSLYQTTHRFLLPEVLVYIADNYRMKGNTMMTTHYYRKAKMAADSLQDHRMDFSIYAGMGMAYGELHNFPLANYYFGIAEKHIPATNNYATFYFYNSRGNIFYHEEKYTEALPYFQKAYAVAKKLKDEESQTIVEGNFGEIYTLLHQYDSARFYLDKTKKFIHTHPRRNIQLTFYLNSLYANLALCEKDPATAFRYLQRNKHAIEIAPQNKFLHYRRMMEYYAQTGNYKEAYRLRNIVDLYDDSLRNIRNTANIREQDYRYTQDTTLLRRNLTIKDKNTQLAYQRNTIALLVAGLLLALLLFIFWKHKNEQRILRQRKNVDSLRMENIRNRVSPHYMFNVLNGIMPLFKQYPSLERILSLFINVLRDNLLISDHIAIPLTEEITLVKNFAALRKEANPDSPVIEWHIGSEVALDTLIPSMVIQIPVENALKHAFTDTKGTDKRITIDIINQHEGIDIRIKDNGKGFLPGALPHKKRGTGTGLKVLFHTIELLNKSNSRKATFHISLAHPDSTDKGTLTSVFIPYHYEYKL